MGMCLFTDDKMKLILNDLKRGIRKEKFSSSKFPIFVFICGESILDNSNKVRAAEELRREKNKRQFILDNVENISKRKAIGIIAEKLIETFKNHDSLTFEGILADVSDEIVIIVESPGTMCELGAFSFSQGLVEKLYILNDIDHETDESFVNRGPIRKIRKAKGTCKYIIYDTDIWNTDPELEEHFKKLEKMRVKYTVPIEVGQTCQIDIKNFIYEVLNVVSLFQPVTLNEFMTIYKFLRGKFTVKDSQNKVKQVSVVFEMLVKLGLIQYKEGYYMAVLDTCCNDYMFEYTISSTEKIRTRILNIYRMDMDRIGVMSK